MTSAAAARGNEPVEPSARLPGLRGTAAARLLEAVRSKELLLQAAVLLLVAFLTRLPRIGDPAITGDEQFYLLVGDRIWQGALPFVDIWDRKPIGLFLLYALFRPLSPDGVLAYQVAATLFATATALVLARIARRMARPVVATIAGALYLVYLPIVGGAGGQSPVFYDLFTAGAALLVVRCLEGADQAVLRRNGFAAMLLVGCAMQVKYTAMFEGAAFGLALLWARWRLESSVPRLAVFAVTLIACALLPTALAFGAYAIGGHASLFLTANFVSIFQKVGPRGSSAATGFLISSALKMAPLMLLLTVAVAGAALRRKNSPLLVFALVWLAFALLEFFALGHYFDHYAIPLLMPAVIVLASLFDWRPFAIAAPALAALTLLISQNGLTSSQMVEDRQRVAALTQALSPYARQGCIYLADGPPILYLTTRSCLPTRYPFPGHLADAEEAVATDATASMAALLRSRPSAIVVGNRPNFMPPNKVTAAMLAAALTSGYRLETTLPDTGPRKLLVYVRNDLS